MTKDYAPRGEDIISAWNHTSTDLMSNIILSAGKAQCNKIEENENSRLWENFHRDSKMYRFEKENVLG